MAIKLEDMCFEYVSRRLDGRLDIKRCLQGMKTSDRRNSYKNFQPARFRRFRAIAFDADSQMRGVSCGTPRYPFDELKVGEYFFVPAKDQFWESVRNRLASHVPLRNRRDFRFYRVEGGVRVQRIV